MATGDGMRSSLKLIQRVNFNDSYTGSAARAAHDRGVVRAVRGQRGNDGGLSIVRRGNGHSR